MKATKNNYNPTTKNEPGMQRGSFDCMPSWQLIQTKMLKKMKKDSKTLIENEGNIINYIWLFTYLLWRELESLPNVTYLILSLY